jgi:hypothetical protein
MKKTFLYEYWDMGNHYKVWSQTFFGYTTYFTTHHYNVKKHG